MASEATVAMPVTSIEEKGTPLPWRDVLASRGFPTAVVLALAVLALFFPLVRQLPDLWFSPNSYYEHGALVPILAGAIFLYRWDRIRKEPAGASWLPILGLVPLMYIVYVASRTEMLFTLSFALIACIGLIAWMASGFKRAWAAAPAIFYLLFALPVWSQIIDRFTQPMQEISAKVAIAMLQGFGFNMIVDRQTILMDRFEMTVAAPCSGLRLALSLIALVTFFILIARLGFFANMVLALFTVPFAILINGLRIAMIGVVGNTFGSDMGKQFHDWSGYIALAICFVALQRICLALGWEP